MAAAFVQAATGTTVDLGSLQEFTARNDFPEFFSASFPVFALDSLVDHSELENVVDIANRQARDELGFEDEELAEMGYPAAVPATWQLHDKSPSDAISWFHDQFSKRGNGSDDSPQWYPLAFLGVASRGWREEGVALVYYDARSGDVSENISVKAFRVDPDKLGSTLISLRQGDDDYENVRQGSALG